MRALRLLLIFGLIAAAIYGIYSCLLSRRIHQVSEKSTAIAKERFFKAQLNDTISRIEEIYKDSCRYSFWIKNYSMDYIVIDVCKYPVLRKIERGARILKDSNSGQCHFIQNNNITIDSQLEIEY
jgi:hypothetical protein